MTDTATPEEPGSACAASDLSEHRQPSKKGEPTPDSTTPDVVSQERLIGMKLAEAGAPDVLRIDIELEERRNQIRKANESP